MARSLSSGGMRASKRRNPRAANEAIWREFSKWVLSTMDFLQLFEDDFVFVKGGAEFRARVGRCQLRKLDGAPPGLEGLQTGGVWRLVAVAGVVALAPGAVIHRPADHLAVERRVGQI